MAKELMDKVVELSVEDKLHKQAEELIDKGTMSEIRDLLDSIVKYQNEKFMNEDVNAAYDFNKDVDDLVKRYTLEAKKACYEKCLATDDPMKEAVIMESFGTITVKSVTDKETDLISVSVIPIDREIDLLDLHRSVKGGIGNDKAWLYKCQKLNYLMAVKVGQAIGDSKWLPENLTKTRDSFMMHEIAQAFEFGDADPVSNNQLCKTMTTIIESMVGKVGKAKKADIAYLEQCYAKKDRGCRKVQLPNHSTFVKLMKDICHNTLTGEGYTVDSRCIKKQK